MKYPEMISEFKKVIEGMEYGNGLYKLKVCYKREFINGKQYAICRIIEDLDENQYMVECYLVNKKSSSAEKNCYKNMFDDQEKAFEKMKDWIGKNRLKTIY